MYALDEELAHWDSILHEVQGAERLRLLSALAWHLRQRDPARASQLSAEIVPLLGLLPAAEAALQRARLQLIAAEPAWLRGELDAAQFHLEQALLLCAQAAPALPVAAAACRADACWVLAWVSNDRGVSAAGDSWLRQAAAAAREAADPVRIDGIDAASGICDAFGDWPVARPFRHQPGRRGADRGRLDQRLLRHLRFPAQRVWPRHRPPDAEL